MRTQSSSLLRCFGGVVTALALVALTPATIHAGTSLLGATALLEGPTAGSDSVVLAISPEGDPWTATSNDIWLHLSVANQGGIGSTNVVINFDANPGATRVGTLTIAGQTLTVTQAAPAYVLSKPAPNVLFGSGLDAPNGIAVDGSGNVYIADTYNNAIKEIIPNTAGAITLVGSGLSSPTGVAVDGAGNVYFSDTGNNAVKMWVAASNTVNTLVASGLSAPGGVAVDRAGNVYIGDRDNGVIKKWTAASNTVTTLVACGTVADSPLAVDVVGNVYYYANGGVSKWTAANNSVTTLVNSGLYIVLGLAVDGAGNVYIANDGFNQIMKWTAASNTVSTLMQFSPNAMYGGIAVDGSGNLYYPYFLGVTYTIFELPRGFVDPTPKFESPDAGNDSLSPVLPVNAPVASGSGSDQPWLSITSITNGVVSFSFTSTLSNRTAHISLLGQSISVTQSLSYSLATNAVTEGPAAGGDNVSLTVTPERGIWTATANASWLHINAASQSGTGSTNIGFSFDTNPGAARVGTLTIAGQNLTVTQQPSPAYLSPTTLTEGYAASSDSVSLILNQQSTQWTATANDSWLHLGASYQNGTGSATIVFSFDANPGYTRVGTLSIAGQTLTVTQQGPSYYLGTSVLLEGPAAGTDSVALAISPETDTWTASAIASWLHLSPANQSGRGSSVLVFGFDSNPDSTRVGTLTIAGKTLAVTQAGPNYVAVPAPVTALVSTGLSFPSGLAVDGSGNVYIADSSHSLIKKWIAASNTVTTLVASGLLSPSGVALDGAGNVYIADSGHSALKKWIAASNTVTTLVASGLSSPSGVALDGAGNVYIADTGHNAVKEWIAASNIVTNLVASGLNQPGWVSVDVAGNVYIADTFNNAIKKWTAASNSVTTVVGAGLIRPSGIAVDGSGNIYISDTSHNAIKKWTVIDNTVRTLISSGLNSPKGVTIDGIGNIYLADYNNNAIKELPHAWVDPTIKLEGPAAGSDVLPVGLPAAINFLPPFAPTSDQAWLTNNGVTNGVLGFSFGVFAGTSRTAHLTLLGQSVPVTQLGSNVLGTTALLEGPMAGTDSVVLRVTPATALWTAKTNVSWLHLSQANQGGIGSINVVFSFDVNPGDTRTGTFTIAGWTLTVTQAGSSFVPAPQPVTRLAMGLNSPGGLAVDSAGNVYFADKGNNAVKKWLVASNTVTTLIASGLNAPSGVTVDGSGNIYIADTGNNAIKKWIAANGMVATLPTPGLVAPSSVAVDTAGDVYIADTGNNAIKEWMATSNAVATLVASGLNGPTGVAVDAAGNVYIADTGNNAIQKWTAANNSVTTMIGSALNGPQAVAVDGSGNVYIADTGNNLIKKWTFANNSLATLIASGLSVPSGVALDGSGNVYIADTGNNAIEELLYAFVNPSPQYEGADAGSDAPMLLLLTANLLAPYLPTSDQSWLTITASTNGAVSFAFTANLGAVRTANLTLLGQSVPIVQAGPSFGLGTTSLLEGPVAGTDSVVVAVSPSILGWSAAANTGWLHLAVTNQSGTGSTNEIFSFDANTGATRTGTLTIAGQNLTVTQAGSTYVPAPAPVTTLVAAGLNEPLGVAVDATGNVYIADYGNGAVEKWTAASNTVTTLVSSGLASPAGVAVDAAGNVYIAAAGNNSIQKWTASSNTLTTLISSGLAAPFDVAVDRSGNIYIADLIHSTVEKYSVLNHTLTTLVSVFQPSSVAVDAAGNVYIADYSNNAIRKWTAANNTLTTLVSSGLNWPNGVAVDGSGNVYIADTFNGAIKKWTAANNTVTTLVSSGLNRPESIAVDRAGNVYIPDSYNNAVKELPRAFVDPTVKSEGPVAGSDVLPVMLPATANLLPPFSPSTDQPWLNVTGLNNGIVSFAFGPTVSNRTANITILGQNIPVTQAAPPVLIQPVLLASGAFQFAFTYSNTNASFTVLTCTNLSLPLTNWTMLGLATNTAPGFFQFTGPTSINDQQRFYRVSSP